MSYQVPTHFAQQFERNVQFLAQQEGSLLRGCVYEENVVGDRMYIDQIGKVTPVKVTTRHADTPLISTPHARRRIVPYPYDWADLIDREDQVRMLHDLTSPYARAGAMAMGVAQDQEIIGAFFATAYTGQDGTTQVPFPASQTVAVNSWVYEAGSGNSGLTVSKIIEAKVKLDGNRVSGREERYIACTAADMGTLLSSTKATSVDYVNVKALVEGLVPHFMGFQFKPTEEIQLDSNGFRRVAAWAKNGMGLGIAREINTRIDQLPTKRYSTQVYASMDIGAARLEEAKVVEIKCA